MVFNFSHRISTFFYKATTSHASSINKELHMPVIKYQCAVGAGNSFLSHSDHIPLIMFRLPSATIISSSDCLLFSSLISHLVFASLPAVALLCLLGVQINSIAYTHSLATLLGTLVQPCTAREVRHSEVCLLWRLCVTVEVSWTAGYRDDENIRRNS